MQQLTAMDEIWFSLETDATPMSMMMADIFTPPSRGLKAKVSHSDVLDHIRRKLPDLPLKMKLVKVPFSLNNSYWVEDENFDLTCHVTEIALPKPGTWEQFKSAVIEISAKRLDLTKPLWEITHITGLDSIDGFPKGSFAIATKMHHGQFDGGALMRYFQQFYDHSPDPDPIVKTDSEAPPQKEPSTSRILYRALTNALARPVKITQKSASSLRKLPQNLSAMNAQLKASKEKFASTHFYSDIKSNERIVDVVTFDLKTILAMRKLATGAKFNDIIIAICGGAIRQLLQECGELPDQDMKILAPISLRKEEEENRVGNKISFMMPLLGTSEVDPIRRLEMVKNSTVSEKEMVVKSSRRESMEIFEEFPGLLADTMIKGFRKTNISKVIPDLHSGISITNIPGSKNPLYICGARLTSQLPVGFLMGKMGLLIGVSSYVDTVLISVTSSPSLLPDTNKLTSYIQASFDEYASLL